MKNFATPWGPSQQSREIAPGIVSHSTAGHGGLHLSEERWYEFRKQLPTQTTWAGARWFEEDLDWALVAIAFPQHFEDTAIYNAVRTVEASARPGGCGHDYLGEARAFLLEPAAAALVKRARDFEAKVHGRWEVTSFGSAFGANRDAWGGGLRNTASGERKRLDFKAMPEQQFYTESEVALAAA